MKNCRKCGQSSEVHAPFCSHCGEAFRVEDSPPPPPSPPPPEVDAFQQDTGAFDQSPPTQGGGIPMGGGPESGFPVPPNAPDNPVISLFHQYAGSRAMLVAVLSYAMVAILSFAIAFVPQANLMETFREGFEAAGGGELPREFYEFFDTYGDTAETVNVGSALAGALPAVLIAIGLFMVYNAGRNRTYPVKTGGLSFLRGYSIFMLVLMFLIPVLLVIVTVAVGVLAGQYASGDEAAAAVAVGVMIGITTVVLIVMVLPIIYLFALIKTLKNIRLMVVSGQPVGKISGFVIVMNYIVGALAILGCLSSLSAMAMPGMMLNGILSTLSGVCSTVFYFAVTNALGGYKRSLERLQFASHSPYAPGAPMPGGGFPPPPPPPGPYGNYPPQGNPYGNYPPQPGQPYQANPYGPPPPPPQPREFVFCHVCSKQYGDHESVCPHCGAPRV